VHGQQCRVNRGFAFAATTFASFARCLDVSLQAAHFFSFFEMGQKLCPNQFIKKKRIVQFINGKLGKNQYNKTTNNTQRLTNKKTHKLAQHTTTTN
jgi:aromatic ring-opening dioxygenase LigB subunit